MRVVAESTSNFAFGALAIGFIVFVTARGELGKYIQLFFYTPPGAPAVPGATINTGFGQTITSASPAGSPNAQLSQSLLTPGGGAWLFGAPKSAQTSNGFASPGP